jgi:hypothetical protein
MGKAARIALLGILGLAAVVTGTPSAGAATPAVHSVVEGRDTSGGKPVLVLLGTGLTAVRTFALADAFDVDVGPVLLQVRSRNMLVLAVPEGLPQGVYSLTLGYGKGLEQAHQVVLSNGSPLPGTVQDAALSTDLRVDLEDAVTLGGHLPQWYCDASNLEAGTLDPARFSAFADLTAETKVGTSAGQVAAGDHLHDGRYYTKTQADSQFTSVTGLSSAGTINTAGNPVDWTKLKGVPAGIADGTDADTTYTAAANGGLALSSNAFSVSFAGTGTANTSARSDHNHTGTFLPLSGGTLTGPVSMALTSSLPLSVSTSAVQGTAIRGEASNGNSLIYGVYGAMTGSNGYGVYGTAAAVNGTGVYGTGGGYGVRALGTGSYGLYSECTNVSGAGFGVYSKTTASSGIAVYGNAASTSGSTTAVWGNAPSDDAVGVFGQVGSSTGSTIAVWGQCGSSSGVAIYGQQYATSGTTYAVHGKAASGSGFGVFAENTASTGVALLAKSGSSADIAVFQAGSTNKARIDGTGKGYFNGGTQTGGADFAESVAVDRPKAEFEPGDVIVVDVKGDRRFARSSAACSPLVAGVYSTKPGVLAAPYDVAEGGARDSEIPLAVVGIVPCKVCDEGGAIERGDLLVTSSKPGRAMKAPASPKPGTILGKSLARLEKGEGAVEVLLMAR